MYVVSDGILFCFSFDRNKVRLIVSTKLFALFPKKKWLARPRVESNAIAGGKKYDWMI